jgi:hypothetical protein
MQVFRPSYHSPIYEPATYSTKKGKRIARFRLPKSGMYVTGEVIGTKARILSPLYFARIRKNGKSVRVALGVTDKSAAEQLAAQLQLKADHQRAGIIDPMAEHRGIRLADHLVDYRKLCEWSVGRPGNSRLFHLFTAAGNIRQTHRIIARDLKAAGVPYEGQLGFADFHSLRTTFITNVCRRTDQFTAMRLARHTKATITARHYDKVLLAGKADVVALLPAPSSTTAAAEGV